MGRARPEMTDPKGTLALLVSPVTLAPLVKSVLGVKMEQREREERTANKDKQAPPDPLVRMDLLAPQERGVLLGQEDLRDDKERRAARETQVPMAPQERLAPWGHRAPQENQERKA